MGQECICCEMQITVAGGSNFLSQTSNFGNQFYLISMHLHAFSSCVFFGKSIVSTPLLTEALI